MLWHSASSLFPKDSERHFQPSLVIFYCSGFVCVCVECVITCFIMFDEYAKVFLARVVCTHTKSMHFFYSSTEKRPFGSV